MIVLIQGLDTIKEMDDCVEQLLFDRRLATLTLDESGNGEVIHVRHGIHPRSWCLTGRKGCS